MKDEDLWDGLAVAMRVVFVSNGRDPAYNFDVLPHEMGVRIRGFGDPDEWLRFRVTPDQLQDPARTAADIYAEAERASKT